MGRRRLARDRSRGGEDVQALRQARTRVGAGAGAVACATALAALPLARADDDAFLEPGFRVAAVALVALVAAVVLGWSSLVPASLVVLGGMYGAELAIADAPLDAATPLFAAGLLLTAELAYWAIEEREAADAEPGEGLRRVAFVALLALGALLVAALLLALADSVSAAGLAVDLVGATAAAAVLIVVLITRQLGRTGATRSG